MPLKSKTLRKMPPTTRKMARLMGELESVASRIKNALPEIQALEGLARAEASRSPQVEIEKLYVSCIACGQDCEMHRGIQTSGPELVEAVKHCPFCGAFLRANSPEDLKRLGDLFHEEKEAQRKAT